MITYKFPKSFWEIAEQIGYSRGVVNQPIMTGSPRFDRGEKNSHVNTIGIVGELIVLDYLKNNDIEFKMGRLLDYKPSKEADFIVKGKRLDVKTSKHSMYSSILVNEEAHKKGLNKIDSYWFVYILDDSTAEFYFADYKEVSHWNCKLMKYTNAYYIKRESL